MIKETNHKDIKILNISINNRIPLHMKQKTNRGKKKGKSIIIIRGFHTLFSSDIENLKNSTNWNS